jgi:hypothetical protein
MTLIFKYFSEDVLGHAFVRKGHVGIKCSLPQDYNDPFELFLGVRLDQKSELLATYRDVVQEIPSQLTTCFSKSPVVSPMWAHYGTNHRGFVVGFDVSELQNLFADIFIRDIAYLDRPDDSLIGFTEMAAYRKKPRDAMHLRQAVRYHAYFSKYSEWSYEQEVRAVNLEDYAEDVAGHKIFYIPEQCVAVIIAGAKSSVQTSQALQQFADALDAKIYSGRIGRSFPTPYLIGGGGDPSVFANGGISVPEGVCSECAEPLKVKGELCPWCSIDETDQRIASTSNPFRILENYGLLENYVKTFPTRPRKPYK